MEWRERGRKRMEERENNSDLLAHNPSHGLRQAKAVNHRLSFSRWQLNVIHYLLPPRMSICRKVESELESGIEPGKFDGGMWAF